MNLYDLLINNQFWFSNPSDFNDPYDCNIAFNRSYSEEEITKFFKTLPFNDGSKITPKRLKERVDEWMTNPQKMYEHFITPLKQTINSKGICCFSGTDKSLLMWSHYADSHKGVCIGFDKDSLDSVFRFISWVNYDNKFPEVNLLSDLNESIAKIMLHKSDQWEYEQEIRINQFEKKHYQFKKEAIKEVIFGLRTPTSQIITLMNLMQQCSYEKVDYKKVFLKNDCYDITYGRLELKEEKN